VEQAHPATERTDGHGNGRPSRDHDPGDDTGHELVGILRSTDDGKHCLLADRNVGGLSFER